MAIVSSAGRVLADIGTTVTGAGTTVASDAYVRTVASVDYTGRMALKVEQLLDEIILTLQVARPVMVTVARALDDGFLDQLSATMRQIDAVTGVMGKATGQFDVVLPLIDATAPITGMVSTGLGQVNSLPGLRRVRRAMTPRPPSPPPSPPGTPTA
jgi:hypothetical protein